MEWLSGVIGVGASAASGGLFGFLGSVVGQVSKHWQEKQRQQWEMKKWAHEEELLRLNMEAKSQETEAELAITAQEGSWSGLNASHKNAVDQPSYRWVAAVKSLFRPFITVVLWILAALVFFTIADDVSGLLDPAERRELLVYMVYSVFFTACTATAWWFGDRALTPANFKNK
ncbi:hypothetical protein [Microbulbifer sp. JSM ZJ756]|uniref:hypothetical protein n=1 Tax=Microbulbifer sp. JSM ZJ756 TaxID=3376191 RepID=UPI0037AE916C